MYCSPTDLALNIEGKHVFNRVWLLAVIGLVAIVAVACGNDNSSGKSIAEVAAGGSSDKVGTAPAISGETFTHGDFSLDMHEGKPVLVNFWFPSCPPCRAEMPDLQAAYEKYGEEVAFIGVQLLGLDSAANGQAFVRELGLTYPSMPDIGSTVQLGYEVFSFPTTIFLDKNHNIARTWTGIIGEDQLGEQLDALLAS
ncbi:MAG: TlpA family protein disulfide reductase [Chloroflexi bacterium]|nr:TlpA family protein disulfide reductase [Chloroflexota bacterium]